MGSRYGRPDRRPGPGEGLAAANRVIKLESLRVVNSTRDAVFERTGDVEPEGERPSDARGESDAADDAATVKSGASSGSGAPYGPPRTHEGWGVTDQRTEEDDLDFETYVDVLYDFLTHDETDPPLTVSIEGRWGTGKSSFMALLGRKLERVDRGNSTGDGTRYFTVEFNPWRHEREDALWAAFMLEFFHQITGRLPLWRRWLGHLELAWRRVRWRRGRRDLVRLGLVVPLVALVVWFPEVAAELGAATELEIPITGFGLALGRGISVVVLGVWTWRNVASPVETELRAYIADPEYEDRVSFIERFHADFGGILDSYVGHDARVFVFIDDLDRCPPSKAAELIQSINLMISTGDSRVFFLLGMDRGKVAAGIAEEHEELLGYLRASEQRAGTSASRRRHDEEDVDPSSGDRASAGGRELDTEAYGLAFADNYLEKFIQIPFLIPKPREREIEELVRTIVEGDEANGERPGGDGEEPGTDDERREVLSGQELVDLTGMVAPAFDYNPRMVKTFVNLFRLRTMLAAEVGLFDEEGADLTEEQLAKFVAISLEWPPLVESIREAEHATDLTGWALEVERAPANGPVPPPPDVPGMAHVPRQERPRLANLLAAGIDEDGRSYRLEEVPDELFWISPRTDTPSRTGEKPPTEA